MTSAGPKKERTAPPGPNEPWTILRMIRWSGEYLEEKGIERGRVDAEHLLAEALGIERLQLYLQFDRPLTPEELESFKPMLLRRADREPLQYILGRASFRELELRVDPRVLIPRPETEMLVQAVLDWSREGAREEPSALDVGTGSGCVALSLALEGPFGRVVATDPDRDALELARENAEGAGVGDRVEFRAGSLFDTLAPGESFEVVVSNPPYVGTEAVDGLEPEVVEWEPEGALFAGSRGFEVLEPLIRDAPERVLPGGLLALEVGEDQAREVAERIRSTGSFQEPRIQEDLSGRDRIVLAIRRG